MRNGRPEYFDFDGNPRRRVTDDMLSLIRLCQLCEGGMGSPVWPDGGAVLDQPVKLIAAFNHVRSLSQHYRSGK